MMPNTEDTVLVVIDVQEKLFRVMNMKEALSRNLQILVKAAEILEIPLIITEQNPAGLGPTIPELVELIPGVDRIPKFSFSCCGEPAFMQAIEAVNRRNILVTGIEAHICVSQTAVELVEKGYRVQAVADGIDSRTAFNNMIGMEKLKAGGVGLTSTETVLFELLKTARHDRFADIQKLIK
jgi:nicotinamidase-related amidase